MSLILEKEIVKNLKQKGFLTSKDNGKVLHVSVLRIKYQSLWGIITLGSQIDTTLEAVVIDKNNRLKHSKTYEGNVVKRHFLVAPLASTNEKNINLSFQSAIENMLNDKDLIKSLLWISKGIKPIKESSS